MIINCKSLMCLHDNVFNIYLKYVQQFEINLMSMEYSKVFLTNAFIVFQFFEWLKNAFKKWHNHEQSLSTPLHSSSVTFFFVMNIFNHYKNHGFINFPLWSTTNHSSTHHQVTSKPITFIVTLSDRCGSY
jgi:hypothetical protein